MLRLAVINDDEVVMRGVAAMVRHHSNQFEIVDLAGATGRPVDVALYDTFSADNTDRPLLRRLVADPRIRKVVVYTWNFHPWVARDVIGQGAAGYLSKKLRGDELVTAPLKVHEDQVVVSPLLDPSGVKIVDPVESLTPRETQVLTLIAKGLSNDDISQQLCLANNSIKSYIRSCYRKIGVSSRSQAVLWALEHGLRTTPVNNLATRTDPREQRFRCPR